MAGAEQRPEILDLITKRDWTTLRAVISPFDPPQVADLLLNLGKTAGTASAG